MSKKTPEAAEGQAVPKATQDLGHALNAAAEAAPGEEQVEIPETQEPEAKEPRTADEISRDFRMAIFSGMIEKLTENWKENRELTVQIKTHDRTRLADGLSRFSGREDLTFRVMPRQPRLNDKEPEEFGTKVPAFCVAMVERLEKESAGGKKGWHEMSKLDLEQLLENQIGIVTQTTPKPEEFQRRLVNIANYAFFIWHQLELARIKDRP